MDMATSDRAWTVAEALALPDDGRRHEVIDGELVVTPAPSLHHQAATGALYAVLRSYLARQPVAFAFLSPADIVLGPRMLVQPDVFVVAPVSGRRPEAWSEIRELLLAVEILSPSTARTDRTGKRRLYQRERVSEYWIVDLDARVIERWLPEDERPEILVERLVWHPEGAAEPLVVDLAELFEEILQG